MGSSRTPPPGVSHLFDSAEVSLDGRWLRVNTALCRLLDYAESELLNLKVREVTHPDDRAHSVTIVDRALRHHEQPQEELKRYLRKDCQVVWVLLKTTLKRDPQGQPTHFLSFLEDVTDRVRNEPLARALARRVQSMQEQERQRIARELHDELGQVLSALKLELQWLQAQLPKNSQARTERLALLADSILSSVKRLWLGLRPSILDELGLEAALDWLLQETCGLNGIPWTFTPAERLLRLDSRSRITLFRLCKEALTLLLEDEQSQWIKVALHQNPGKIQLVLAAKRKAPLIRNGKLLAIQDPASLLEAHLDIQSEPPEATQITVTLPLKSPSDDTRRVPPDWA